MWTALPVRGGLGCALSMSGKVLLMYLTICPAFQIRPFWFKCNGWLMGMRRAPSLHCAWRLSRVQDAPEPVREGIVVLAQGLDDYGRPEWVPVSWGFVVLVVPSSPWSLAATSCSS
ncbi:UNVERIFIED_CONTAM: hypothetical protein K2H54_031001 [Gekko kuhli]